MRGRIGLAAQDKRERNKINQKRRFREYNYKDSEAIHRITAPTNLKAKPGRTLSRGRQAPL